MEDGITPLSEADAEAIANVVNEAAKAYDDTIPEDCYSQPYLSLEELADELETTEFYGYAVDSADSASMGVPDVTTDLADSAGALVGVVGFEEREDCSLVRRLYVLPDFRGEGIGSKLLDFALGQIATDPVLVGTWRDAEWAVGFYEKNGFTNLGTDRELLRAYWDHSERRNAESVVLRYER